MLPAFARGDTNAETPNSESNDSAEVRDTEPHDDDADVVKSALEKFADILWSLVTDLVRLFKAGASPGVAERCAPAAP